MSNTIVMNTLTGAVSEYTGFPFQSITPTHAGSAVGLWSLAGERDGDQPILSRFTTAQRQWGDGRQQHVPAVYLSMTGSGQCALTVHGAQGAWRYPFPVLATGRSRVTPGRGIRENYLAFTFENPSGQAFALDRIEILDTPSKRRI